MKPVRHLGATTPGLADYRETEREHPNWEGFRSHRAGAALAELRDVLVDNQHGLCAYCEIVLEPREIQIEHVVPRSAGAGGAALELDIGNLLACCLGGAKDSPRRAAFRRPIRNNLSCGEAKGNRARGGPRRLGRLDALRIHLESIVYAEAVGRDPLPLPIVAFYDSDRRVQPDRHPGARPPKPGRFAALDGALSPRPDFRPLFAWFAAKEREEKAARRERSDLGFRLPELDAVRRAVAAAIPGLSDPTIAERPPRFSVSVTDEAGTERLALDRLGGGDRLLLALVADLARRMAQANPHFPEQGKDPLQAEAVVLIDEVELHLHPSREQRVLPDLQRAFPNTQFLVSTNSPQVLSTVESDRLVDLEREDGKIVAGGVVDETYGAEAGNILQAVMRVRERPDNDYVRMLDEYTELVDDGDGETQKATGLRRNLEEISPRDPELSRADSEMRRQRVLHRLGRTSDRGDGARPEVG